MKRILITRPRSQADQIAKELRIAGLEPIYFPVIEIHPIKNNIALQKALNNLLCYDWVVFTSVNGVKVVWEAMERMRLGNFPENVQIAAIGPVTAEALKARNIPPSFVPDKYIAEAVVPGLGDLRERWVLLPRAEIARKVLPETIVQAGGVVHEIVVYRTLPAKPDPQGLLALLAGVDFVTLTSPSTVHNFVAITRAAGLDPLSLPGNPMFACIGPITEQAARVEGLSNLILANEYTTIGLIEAIKMSEAR